MRRGYTLLEALLSVSIITLLAGVSLPIYLSFQTQNDANITTQTIAESLRRASLYSRSVKGDSQWGVRLSSSDITFYKGATYATRDTTYDEVTSIPTSMTQAGLSEVAFAKLTGLPSTTGSITLSGSFTTKTITINSKGMVGY